MIRRVQAATRGFLILYGAVAVALVYWSVMRAPDMLARDDNPRLVEAALRIERGRILDRYSVPLAETRGQPGRLERWYATPWSPAVGYYSFRYGVAGIESTYDSVLTGRNGDFWRLWWDELLHRQPGGRDVRLSLDSSLQLAADLALGGRKGAVVVLDALSGDILALVSHPTFEPSRLDEQFGQLRADPDSPLLNRATQGLYQPGTALQPFLYSLGLEQRLVSAGTLSLQAGLPVPVGSFSVECVDLPEDEVTVVQAMAYGCPEPFRRLGERLGPVGLVMGLKNMGFYDFPAIPLPSAPAAGLSTPGSEEELLAEVMGQGSLVVTPLQMAWAVTTLANDGTRPAVRLVLHVGGDQGGWEIVVASAEQAHAAISPETIALVTEAMVQEVKVGAARSAGSPHVMVAGHVGRAVTGPDEEDRSWFIGFAPAYAPSPLARFAVAVLLEDTGDVDQAASIGRAVLESAATAGR
jgi:peptidoglycan glycosyltransferase